MKINTSDLQALIPILKNVVGNNELKPKTTMLGIKTTADSIVFYTAGRDRIKVPMKITNPDQGVDLAVNANLFLGLIDKITTSDIEISVDDATKCVVVKGNGNYKLSKQISEVGDIKFEEIDTTNLSNPLGTLTKDFITTVIKNNSHALLSIKDGEDSNGKMSTGNYHILTDKVVTSDGDIISKSIEKSGLSQKISLDPGTIASLKNIGQDAVVYDKGTELIFVCGNIALVAPKVTDADQFPLDALEETMDDKLYTTSVTVDKSAILAAIDRLSLFNNDNSGLTLTFGNNTVELSVKEEKELVPSTGNGNNFSFFCNTTHLVSTIKATNKNDLIFKFTVGQETMMRLDGTNLVGVISSLSNS